MKNSSCTVLVAQIAQRTIARPCARGALGFCTGLCTATVANGAACTSGSSAQCTNGFCSFDQNQGGSYCSAYRADGAACDSDNQCGSGACVADLCATPPLVDGSVCDNSLDCASGFCNTAEDTATCRTPPLANGIACSLSSVCASGVCFEGMCQTGAATGTACGAFDDLPCNPNASYCGTTLDEPACVSYRAPGESCTRSSECRGSCTVRWGRRMCDALPNPGAAICDGT